MGVLGTALVTDSLHWLPVSESKATPHAWNTSLQTLLLRDVSLVISFSIRLASIWSSFALSSDVN